MPSVPERKRILLDECLPKKLKREFDGCIVSTVSEMGWTGTKNGALMKVASGYLSQKTQRKTALEKYFPNAVFCSLLIANC